VISGFGIGKWRRSLRAWGIPCVVSRHPWATLNCASYTSHMAGNGQATQLTTPAIHPLIRRAVGQLAPLRGSYFENGWTRAQLNDYVNNPDLYQIEDPANNMSHQYEMPK
jgi:HNH/ENDO VII superfamily nuclease with conserved GHE residues